MKRINIAVNGGWRLASFLGMALLPLAASAFTVTSASPQGEVAEVRQVRLQFSEALVPLGDTRLPAPAELLCQAAQGLQSVAGQGRWANEREWLFELQKPLPAGSACVIKARAEFKPQLSTVSGEWSGAKEFRFSTGAPVFREQRPWNGSEIEEDQHILLRLSGAVNPASVQSHAWCEVEGLGERLPLKVLDDAQRLATMKALSMRRTDGDWLLVACQRPFPAGAWVRFVFGKGIAAAANAELQTRSDQRFEYRVRKPLSAEFSCERERSDAPCMPIRPLRVSFSAPIPRALALQLRLKPESGAAIAPMVPKGDADSELRDISFPTPLAENASFRIELPAGIKDASGRPLANAGNFPLTVRTGIAPPIAKFAAAPFGIIEREPSGTSLVPITLRHVQGDLQPSSPDSPTSAGQVLVKRLSSDADILAAYGRLRSDHQEEYESRKRPMLEGDAAAKKLALPQLQGKDPRPFEVVGLPLTEPGYHLLELRSQRLGQSLLASAAPMYVRTGVLVTNLGLHFKLGRENSLVWVTSLDKGQPVAGAAVVVNDCLGHPLWTGTSDAQGLARIKRALEAPEWRSKCPAEQGLFITARKADAQGQTDLAFVFSSWSRGIEPWRFNVPTASGTEREVRAHTVLDRSLLRAGETVSMKHFFRLETGLGLSLARPDQLPTRMKIVHEGSGQSFTQNLQWSGARYAAAQWQIPPGAKLGLYRIELERDGVERRRSSWQSGEFRVEEFRLPLVDARVIPPKEASVAPSSLQLGAQLNYLSGGAMAQAPIRISAVLRPRSLSFAGYEDYSFEPASDPARNESSEEDAENDLARDARLVADKLAFSTDAQGAAKITLNKLPRITRASELLTELSYNDPNGELQTVSQRQPLWPAKVVVGLRTSTWSSNGRALRYQALALDLNGKPLAGQRISVRARLQQTITARKRIVGGFYAYDNHVESKELGEVCSGSSDAQGLLQCQGDFTTPGNIDLIARTSDAEGRVSESARSVWITRQGELWFTQDNDDRIDVLPEKKQYEPGETARLQVRMPFREATVLVAVEREGILQTQVQTLSGRDPTVSVKIDKAWAPNVYVSVLALRGRIREVPWYSFFSWGWREPGNWWREWRASGDYQPPTAMVDLGKPAFKLGVAALQVGLAQHQLQVTVTPEKASYGVREKARVRVKVSQDGQVLPDAELAFAAVDEGLLALRGNTSWELLPAMIQQRAWGVATATAQSEIVGRRHYGRKAVAAGGGGGRATRELFDTLLLWNPRVKLDAKGEAVIEVPLNDSLTSFRLVAVADAGTQAFGSGSATLRVSQDLQLLSGLPPLVREGDQFQAMLTLRNASTRTMNLRVGLKGLLNAEASSKTAPGIARTALNLPPQQLSLAPGAARELQWAVTVPAGVFSVAWEAEAAEQDQPAEGKVASDRLKVLQLVQPAVPLRVQQSTLLQLDGALSLPVATPARALPEQGVKRGGK